MRRVATALLASATACLWVLIPGPPAVAAGSPKAGFSISQTAPATPTTVTFVADSAGFGGQGVSYTWTFGDGATANGPSVSHTYAAFGTYTVTVRAADAGGEAATATGVVELHACHGANPCAAALTPTAGLHQLHVSGPTLPGFPATVDLVAAAYRIANCDTSLGTDAAVTDDGFGGTVDITLRYHPASRQRAAITCFASPIPFVDANGSVVVSGPLPACQAADPVPPCVVSSTINGSGSALTVTKVLAVPPGDPKVGAH